MEEVIGSIPIRSTKYLNNLAEPSQTFGSNLVANFKLPCSQAMSVVSIAYLKRQTSADLPPESCPQLTIAAFAATTGGRSLPFAASFFIVPCNSR